LFLSNKSFYYKMISELEILRNICFSGQMELLDKLSEETREFMIDTCFKSLNQKQGNQILAGQILETLGEITKVHFLSNEAEGIVMYAKSLGLKGRDAVKRWKKLSKEEREAFRPVRESWIYSGDKSKLSYHDLLQRQGVVVLPMLTPDELKRARHEFITTMQTFPEYKRSSQNLDQTPDGHPLVYVLGGFAAFGNPASFHNPFVRRMRLKMKQGVSTLFRTIIQNKYRDSATTGLQLVPDRMMYRHKSQAPSAESWHRDVTPSTSLLPGDEVYGGWLNLDLTQDQYFSCIPGSHLGIDPKSLKSGFASLSPEAVAVIAPHKTKIRIPPGHMVIFPQYILHEVVSTKAKYNMMRLFQGWRTTTGNDFLFPSMKDRLSEQGILPLPSGQEPPMFSANHGSFFRRKKFSPIPSLKSWKVSTIEWSEETFKSEGPDGMPITLPDGDQRLVPRWMRSLEYYGLPMYESYNKEELDAYLPTKI
jgi:hypothetical protein